MTISTGELAAEAAQRIAESLYTQIDEDAVAPLQSAVNGFAASIGESPEAWRGALGMLGMIGTTLNGMPTDLEEARTVVATIHAFMVLVVAHPAAQAALLTKEAGR